MSKYSNLFSIIFGSGPSRSVWQDVGRSGNGGCIATRVDKWLQADPGASLHIPYERRSCTLVFTVMERLDRMYCPYKLQLDVILHPTLEDML